MDDFVDRNRCNSGHRTTVKDSKVGCKILELIGSQSQTSSRKLPYGLNQRRSLQDLGVSGDLKIFSPVANFRKNGMFLNKDYYQNQYNTTANSSKIESEIF